jgi:putative transposase
MHDFKITYSRRYRDKYKPGRVWQNRFWDHIIRDENDMHRYIDYIHYNPVKHGLVNNPFNYAHSSLSEYAKTRSYTPDWGVKDAENPDGEFGE